MHSSGNGNQTFLRCDRVSPQHRFDMVFRFLRLVHSGMNFSLLPHLCIMLCMVIMWAGPASSAPRRHLLHPRQTSPQPCPDAKSAVDACASITDQTKCVAPAYSSLTNMFCAWIPNPKPTATPVMNGTSCADSKTQQECEMRYYLFALGSASVKLCCEWTQDHGCSESQTACQDLCEEDPTKLCTPSIVPADAAGLGLDTVQGNSTNLSGGQDNANTNSPMQHQDHVNTTQAFVNQQINENPPIALASSQPRHLGASQGPGGINTGTQQENGNNDAHEQQHQDGQADSTDHSNNAIPSLDFYI